MEFESCSLVKMSFDDLRLVTIGYVGLRGVNKPLASLNNHLINEIKNEAGSCHEH